MSKYVKKARNIASNQLHHVKDDMTRRQLQRERKSLASNNSRGSNNSNSSYKFSDIEKWMDTDINDDDDDDFITQLTTSTQEDHDTSSLPYIPEIPSHQQQLSDESDVISLQQPVSVETVVKENNNNDDDDFLFTQETQQDTPLPSTVTQQQTEILHHEVSQEHQEHEALLQALVKKDNDDNDYLFDDEPVGCHSYQDPLTSSIEDESLTKKESVPVVVQPAVVPVSVSVSVDQELYSEEGELESDKEDIQCVNNIQTSTNINNDDLFNTPFNDHDKEETSTNNTVTEDPLITDDSTIYHPLLIQEEDENDYYNTPLHDTEIPNRSISPDNMSPLSLSPPPSLPSLLKVNTSGRLVPIVPPRPNSANKRTNNITGPGVEPVVKNDEPIAKTIEVDTIVKPIEVELVTKVIEKEVEPVAKKQNTDDDYYTLLSLSLCVVCLYIYYSLNPFVYLAGFMAGFMLFYLTIGTAFVLYVQYSERERVKRKLNHSNKPTTYLPSMDQLPLTIQVDFETNRILKSNKFGMVERYHPSRHHPSQRLNAKVRLYDDFQLEVRYRKTFQTPQGESITKEEIITKDLRQCSVLLVPEEVALNRKRRWSKKFPLNISWNDSEGKKGHLFLFPFTSRDKEEWFRRLRAAAEGTPYNELIETCSLFYRYMSSYMPKTSSPILSSSSSSSTTVPSLKTSISSGRTSSSSSRTSSTSSSSSRSQSFKKTRQSSSGGNHKINRHDMESVRFSATDSGLEQEDDISVSITHQHQSPSTTNTITTTTKTSNSNNTAAVRNYSPTIRRKYVPDSLPLSIAIGWVNAGMARLAWDLWHEDRWKNWVTSRIQRKLIRIKTPPFMEELKVTEVNMGIDMPVLKRPFKLPKVNQQGLWIYLEVEYIGSFTMTIETKLKLEKPKEDEVLHFTADNDHTHSSTIKHRHGNRPPHVLSEEEEEISSGSDDEETHSLDHHTTAQQLKDITSVESSTVTAGTNSEANSPTYNVLGKKEKMLNSMVSKFQRIAAKSKIVTKAVEKVSSYPLILTVEVKRLEGLLVLNMAPPPSDAIWYGFTENPTLDLVATPKLGQREVTLSYVTDWIEKKLCEVVEKKLVFPNMEDIIIPVLSSGLPEDKIPLIK